MFLVIEGLDGSGKSTVTRFIGHLLSVWSIDRVVTRESGGTPVGQCIRKLYLDKDIPMQPCTEVLLAYADRSEHIETVIWPALKAGKMVISDRFAESTYALQASTEEAQSLARLLYLKATKGCFPDLTIYLRISPELSLQRVDDRGGKKDKMESRPLSFQSSVAERYEERLGALTRCVEIDAEQELAEVLFNVVEQLTKFFKAQALLSTQPWATRWRGDCDVAEALGLCLAHRYAEDPVKVDQEFETVPM